MEGHEDLPFVYEDAEVGVLHDLGIMHGHDY
jgi:hypothetical protein